ncbi:MAG: SDR family NAD(P)-dependent oxidoreductase [Patescibacteria group bacterium]|nr:SDR family NAD(P)-dependent oxidoreductase [Patescibacteria group bacterium]
MKNKSISELFDFSGQVVVVTGGAMGIGYGIVERFAQAGAKVVIADLDDKEGKKKASALSQAGQPALFVKTDVSSEKSVEKLFTQAKKHFGGVDVLVNNAGIFPSVPVLDMDLALWEKIQAINLRGVFLCSRQAAKLMKDKGNGNIINIASIDALHPSNVGLAAYDASKHGVWGFTKNFALEVIKYGIRVNAIAPGGVSTEGVEKMTQGAVKAGSTNQETIKNFTARIPLGRFGLPDDIALPTLFLASEASAYIVGEMIVVDGAYLLS